MSKSDGKCVRELRNAWPIYELLRYCVGISREMLGLGSSDVGDCIVHV